MKDSAAVTTLLSEWAAGSEEALERLTPLVYAELRSLAHRQMRGESPAHLLQTTALVHEAYLRLVGMSVEWRGRLHFFAVAARLMRRVLVDFARAERTQKRGGALLHVGLDEALVPQAGKAPEILRLDDAIEALARFDQRKARVVELRLFAGLTIEETARILEISHATVERDLKVAKAWLVREMDSRASGPLAEDEDGR